MKKLVEQYYCDICNCVCGCPALEFSRPNQSKTEVVAHHICDKCLETIRTCSAPIPSPSPKALFYKIIDIMRLLPWRYFPNKHQLTEGDADLAIKHLHDAVFQYTEDSR